MKQAPRARPKPAARRPTKAPAAKATTTAPTQARSPRARVTAKASPAAPPPGVDRPAVAGAKQPAVLNALYDLVAPQLTGCTREPLRKPKVGCTWSDAEGYWVATVSEFRGAPMCTINAGILAKPALAAAFKLLKPFHDGGNSVLFATQPTPWPPALRTLLTQLGKHVARGR